MNNVMGARIMTERGKLTRINRYPQHRFRVRARPWQVCPFLIAPVLPGESLKSFTAQARSVTKPIKDPIGGWFAEFYWFYVKLRDLTQRDTITGLLIDPNADWSGLASAAQAETFHSGGGVNWISKCLERIMEEYFRDEGQAWNSNMIGNLPAASIKQKSWMDSLMLESAVEDLNVDLNANATITASEVQKALAMYDFLQGQGLATMSYEEFLTQFGISLPAEETHKPELLRYERDWTYPSNTVDPLTGVPVSAASWATAVRADKVRFFKEHGFIVGACCFRPKVYMASQIASASHYLASAMAWLPPNFTSPQSSLIPLVDGATGPFGTTPTSAPLFDAKDLFIYGDEFRNFTDNTGVNTVALPAADLQRLYPTATDADALFVGSTAATRLIDVDGVCSFQIAGAQVDTSARTANVL